MKTKEIIAAVNNLKTVFKEVCGKCASLPSETNQIIEDLREAWNSRYEALAKSINQDTAGMRALLDELREAFQTVCLTCAKVSNDDNPSNHGQTFVSLDSGNCQANSGRAQSTHTDDNVVQSRADWIGLHKSPDIEDQTYGMSPYESLVRKEERSLRQTIDGKSSSILPPEVEDKLRMEFSNFVALDILDKLLLSCVMSGMNIAEFAKMLWFPYSIVEPKTRKVKSITKQAAYARWVNICKRFPVFMSVAMSSAKDNRQAADKLRDFVNNPNGDEPTDKFLNGKLSSAFVKKLKKEKEAAERELEKLRKAKGKALKKKPQKVAKAKSPDKSKQTFLPGMFA